MTETAKLTASDGAAVDYFGYSVAISSDTVVVAAPDDDDNGADSGSAYVFVKTGADWVTMTETAKLTASDGAAYNYFGWAVSVSGDTIVVQTGTYLGFNNRDFDIEGKVLAIRSADPNDRATQESEFGLELRTRDRERKLLRKIDSALARIDDGSYGYCEETGEEIGLKRLEARPVATLCLEAQERRELAERQFRDRDDRYR